MSEHPKFNLADPALVVLDGPQKMSAFVTDPSGQIMNTVRIWNDRENVEGPPAVELRFENALKVCDFYRVNLLAAAQITSQLLYREGLSRNEIAKLIFGDLLPDGLFPSGGGAFKKNGNKL